MEGSQVPIANTIHFYIHGLKVYFETANILPDRPDI